MPRELKCKGVTDKSWCSRLLVENHCNRFVYFEKPGVPRCIWLVQQILWNRKVVFIRPRANLLYRNWRRYTVGLESLRKLFLIMDHSTQAMFFPHLLERLISTMPSPAQSTPVQWIGRENSTDCQTFLGEVWSWQKTSLPSLVRIQDNTSTPREYFDLSLRQHKIPKRKNRETDRTQ